MAAVPGRFNDGKNAASHPVAVHVRPGGIDIRTAQGALLAAWPADDLHSDGPAPCGGLKLHSNSHPDARLIAEDQPELRALAKVKPPPKWWQMAALAIGSLLLGGALYALLPVAARGIAHLIPDEMEREWGRDVAATLVGHLPICRSPAGNAALRAMTTRLSPALAPDQVVVVYDNRVNAFALPGGTVIIMYGLLAKADHPDQVAGVLAHELTHVSERHVTTQLVRALGLGTLVALATGNASGLTADGATALMVNAYSRSDEAEADAGAVHLLQQANISTEGFVRFFEIIAGLGGRHEPAWMSTHPDPKARAAAVTPTSGPTTPALTPEQWTDLKRICRR
jgi:Zn-dependent protease with chaperone function